MTLQTHPDHLIQVTPGGPFGRAYVDCTCGLTRTCATKFAANRSALIHHHETAGCNCPPDVVADAVHPDPGPGSPAPVAAEASTAEGSPHEMTPESRHLS